jgi:hypothetical protein
MAQPDASVGFSILKARADSSPRSVSLVRSQVPFLLAILLIKLYNYKLLSELSQHSSSGRKVIFSSHRKIPVHIMIKIRPKPAKIDPATAAKSSFVKLL